MSKNVSFSLLLNEMDQKVFQDLNDLNELLNRLASKRCKQVVDSIRPFWKIVYPTIGMINNCIQVWIPV